MDVDISRGDVLVLGILLLGSLAIGNATLNQGWQPDTPLERYCVSLAANIESNLSIGVPVDSCRCIPPDRVNESEFQAAEKVENTTDLFLVSCTFDDGSERTFPIRRIRPNASFNGTSGTTINGTNTTVLE